MGGKEQFDPEHFGLYLTESLKDDQTIRIFNKSIDYELLCEKVSIAMSSDLRCTRRNSKLKTKKSINYN